MSAGGLEERVAALEKELADLKKQLSKVEDKRPWWEKIYGAFEGDPLYLKAMEYGRKYRESTRPKPRRKRKNDNP